MSDKTRTKYQDIPFIIDGIAKIVKSVTSQTTCADVINKLPKLLAPLAVYASVDGTEKELSKKTKLLKVWRSHSSSHHIVFVVRRSETGGNTLRRNRSPSLFHSTPKPKKTSSNMALESTRMSAVLDKSTATIYQPRTTKKISQVLNVKPTRDTQAIIEARTTKKLGLKNRFHRVTKTTSESTSTGSLRSSHTGYSSASPDAPQTDDQPMKKKTKLLSDTEDGPRHSTPVVQHTKKQRNEEIETTLDEEWDELQRKSLLLRKFMEDQSINSAPSPNIRPVVPEMPTNKQRRTDNRLCLPAFATKEGTFRVQWSQLCDSEPECCDNSFMHDSTIGISFLDSYDFETNNMETIHSTNQRKNKLRRESAISNLTKFSLHRKETEIAEEAEGVYDFSFDCSFHRL